MLFSVKNKLKNFSFSTSNILLIIILGTTVGMFSLITGINKDSVSTNDENAKITKEIFAEQQTSSTDNNTITESNPALIEYTSSNATFGTNNSDDKMIWIKKYFTLSNLAKYGEAIADFDNSLEIDPPYILAKDNRQKLLDNKTFTIDGKGKGWTVCKYQDESIFNDTFIENISFRVLKSNSFLNQTLYLDSVLMDDEKISSANYNKINDSYIIELKGQDNCFMQPIFDAKLTGYCGYNQEIKLEGDSGFRGEFIGNVTCNINHD